MVRYPPVVLNFTQAHQSNAPYFATCRAIIVRYPIKKQARRSFAILSLQVVHDVKSTIVITSITDRRKILSELFPAILDRIITGKCTKRINLIVIRAHYRKNLAVHRSFDTRTEIPWTKSCNELPDENSPTINSVIFDKNFTGGKFLMNWFGNDSVTIVSLLGL